MGKQGFRKNITTGKEGERGPLADGLAHRNEENKNIGIGGNGGQFCGKGLGEGGKITVGYRLQNEGPAEGEVLL